MELPFTIKFFKKLEYFQDLNRLDIKDKCQKNGTWEVEKKILRWTYWGHKHLGSPLFEFDFFEDDEYRRRFFWYLFDNYIEGERDEKVKSGLEDIRKKYNKSDMSANSLKELDLSDVAKDVDPK